MNVVGPVKIDMNPSAMHIMRLTFADGSEAVEVHPDFEPVTDRAVPSPNFGYWQATAWARERNRQLERLEQLPRWATRPLSIMRRWEAYRPGGPVMGLGGTERQAVWEAWRAAEGLPGGEATMRAWVRRGSVPL